MLGIFVIQISLHFKVTRRATCPSIILKVLDGLQPTDSGRIDVVRPGNVRLGLARLDAIQGFLPLVRRQLARAAELDAAGLSPLAALARASPDQLPLKLRQAAQ